MLFNTYYGKSRNINVKIEKKRTRNEDFLWLLSLGAERSAEVFNKLNTLVFYKGI
jgi:hypothetical protein